MGLNLPFDLRLAHGGAMFLGWLVLCSLTYSTFAQNFSIPLGWRKPTFDLPWEDCITLSQALIDAIAPQVNHSTGQVDGLGFEQNASLFAAIANYDRLVGNRTNEALVTTHLAIVGQQPLKYFGPSEGERRTTFTLIFWMITVADAMYGSRSHFSLLKPGLTIARYCDDSLVAGGVFLDMDNMDVQYVDLYSVGALLSLSAYMFEATNDSRYVDAAGLTAEFAMTFLGKQLNLRLMNMSSCETRVMTLPFSQSVGFAMEGLGVYTSMLPNADLKLAIHMQSMILAVISRYYDGDGIFDEDITDYKPLENAGILYVRGVIVRGLYETLSRIDANSDLAKLIRGFLAVQFNAVLDLARPPNSTLFSPSWRGPPVADRVLPWGQLLALDVLNAGLSTVLTPTPLPNASTSTSPLPSPTLDPSSSASSGAHLSIKSIIGIIVGGVAFVALIVVALLVALWQRSKRNRLVSQPPIEEAPQPLNGEEQYHVTDMPRFLPASAMYQLPSSELGSSETSTMMPSSDKRRSAIVLSYASTSNNAMDGPDAHRSVSPYRPPSVEESIPDLVQRLNRAMTRLPPSGAGHAEELEPPQYESEASHTVF